MMVTPTCTTQSPISADFIHDEEEREFTSDTAVQDGGAASFLGSKPKVVKYLKFLMERGVNPNDVEVYRCNKGFKYGNSPRESTDLCVSSCRCSLPERRSKPYVISSVGIRLSSWEGHFSNAWVSLWTMTSK